MFVSLSIHSKLGAWPNIFQMIFEDYIKQYECPFISASAHQLYENTQEIKYN